MQDWRLTIRRFCLLPSRSPNIQGYLDFHPAAVYNAFVSCIAEVPENGFDGLNVLLAWGLANSGDGKSHVGLNLEQ